MVERSKSICKRKRLKSLKNKISWRIFHLKREWNHNWYDYGTNAIICYIYRFIPHFFKKLLPKKMILCIWIVEASRVNQSELHFVNLVFFNLYFLSDWLRRLFGYEFWSIFTWELVAYFVEQSRLSILYIAYHKNVFTEFKFYFLKLNVISHLFKSLKSILKPF